MIILLHWGFQDGAFTDWPASSPSLSGVTSRRSTGSFSKVGGFPTHFLAQNSDGTLRVQTPLGCCIIQVEFFPDEMNQACSEGVDTGCQCPDLRRTKIETA